MTYASILSHTRVFPSSCSSPVTTPVSITDSACADYAPAGATWFFRTSPGTTDKLVLSLSHVLTCYPQLSGTLSLSPPGGSFATSSHSNRYGRTWLTYGDSDPGVDLTISSWAGSIDSVLPISVGEGVYDGSRPASPELLDASPLVSFRPIYRPGPALCVQITSFSCSGMAIALKGHHTLLDAQSLSLFVNDWARVHSALIKGQNMSLPLRPYVPLELDTRAAGNLSADTEDPALAMVALALPQLRLDFWSHRPGHPEDLGPSWFSAPRAPDPSIDALDADLGRKRGRVVPWSTWDTSAPLLDRLIDFSPSEIEMLHAATGGKGTSRLDAVLAHLWRLIVRARNLQQDTVVYIDSSLGIRSRVFPPLPESFLGSPLVNVSSKLPVSVLIGSHGLAKGAAMIRATLSTFTPNTVPALLHHMAHALDPTREWNCFLGDHHVLASSWLNIGAYDADFSSGRPCHVHAAMPPCDGILVPMESSSQIRTGAKWYTEGLTVRLLLKVDVMEKVLEDPELRKGPDNSLTINNQASRVETYA